MVGKGYDGRRGAEIEEFWRAIRLDLFGTFLGCRFGIPAIIASGGGSVINMASNVALMGVEAECDRGETEVVLHHARRGGQVDAVTKRMKCIRTRRPRKFRVARPLKANSMVPSPP